MPFHWLVQSKLVVLVDVDVEVVVLVLVEVLVLLLVEVEVLLLVEVMVTTFRLHVVISDAHVPHVLGHWLNASARRPCMTSLSTALVSALISAR